MTHNGSEVEIKTESLKVFKIKGREREKKRIENKHEIYSSK